MASSYMLDTNIVTALPREADVAVRVRPEDEIYLCAAVVGELYFAAFNSGRVEANLRQIDGWIARFKVLYPNLGTAREFGRIKRVLRLKGRPIPENDIWIAATAIQHDLILVTRDAHFADVDGLRVEQW